MSGLVIKEFKNVKLKEFREVKREGKSSLYFCEFIDSETYACTGEMMFFGDNAFEVAALLRKDVVATLNVSAYNGRASLAASSIVAAPVPVTK